MSETDERLADTVFDSKFEAFKRGREEGRKEQLLQSKQMVDEPGGLKPGEYMHEWMEKDAVEFDLPTEEIIGALARDNRILHNKLLQSKRTVTQEWVEILAKGIAKSGKQGIKVLEEALYELGIEVEK